MDPSALPASILKRLPVRFNYNDNYMKVPGHAEKWVHTYRRKVA